MPEATVSSSLKPTEPAAAARAGHAYAGWAGAVIAALTIARLGWIAAEPAGLYPDEAQYWVWAKHLAFGYYSKPPLIAWLIALTTALFGDSEWAIRLSAPLLHAIAAGFVYGIGTRLYDRRTGFWSALAYATLPGVSLSCFVISTDAALMPCWAAALYAFVRAREASAWRWWLAVGVAAGFGFLAKYAMLYWLLVVFGFVLLAPAERRHLLPLLAATGVALVILSPNLWWNWQNGFVSLLAVRDNAHLTGHFLHPRSLFEFFAAQFGVMGPLLFAALIVVAARPAAILADARGRLLAWFSLPILALLLAQSLLSHAEPNWAAPAYVAATVLVVGLALGRSWRPWLAAAVALNLAGAIVLFGLADALAVVGIGIPPKYDPLHRLRGWRGLGTQVAQVLAAHPSLTLLGDDRELLAALTYYVHPHPFDAVEWNPVPGISDQWRLTNNIGNHRGDNFLAVTVHNDVAEMRPDFLSLTPLTTLTTRTGKTGGMTVYIYIACDFRGSGRRHR